MNDPMEPQTTPTAGPEPRSTIADRVYGGVAAGAILTAVFFFLFGSPDDGAARTAAADEAAVPALVILSPATGAELDQPLILEFDAGAELRRDAAGWSAGDLHVHLYVGRSELMPGPGDIRPLEGTRYLWRLPRLPAGEHDVRLGWSDPSHRPVQEGASAPILLRLR